MIKKNCSSCSDSGWIHANDRKNILIEFAFACSCKAGDRIKGVPRWHESLSEKYATTSEVLRAKKYGGAERI